MKNYYEILNLKINADSKQVKDAYRKLAKQSHPDLNPDKSADEFKLVQEAYSVLSNPNQRTVYDLLLFRKYYLSKNPPAASTPTPNKTTAHKDPAYKPRMRKAHVKQTTEQPQTYQKFNLLMQKRPFTVGVSFLSVVLGGLLLFAYFMRGYTADHYMLIGNYSKALEYYPNNTEAYFLRGRKFQILSNYNHAINDYSSAIKYSTKPEARFYLGRAICYRKTGRLQAAIADLHKSLEINSNLDSSHFILGQIYLEKLKNYQVARCHFDTAIGLNKNNYDAYISRGKCLLATEATMLALADFNKAIKLKPDFGEAYYYKAGILWHLKGQVYFMGIRQII